MKHPMHIINPGAPVTGEQQRELRENCSDSSPGPEDDETTFRFRAESINDTYDRIIIVNNLTRAFLCLPQPHCSCRRNPLECECQETICPICRQPFVGVSIACDSEFCVQDDCPLCQHQRENCMAEQVREDIMAERDSALTDSPQEPQAHAYVLAIAKILAPGVGEAPIFPVTVRILDELLGERRDGAWTCPDGSRIQESIPGWLEYEP